MSQLMSDADKNRLNWRSTDDPLPGRVWPPKPRGDVKTWSRRLEAAEYACGCAEDYLERPHDLNRQHLEKAIAEWQRIASE